MRNSISLWDCLITNFTFRTPICLGYTSECQRSLQAKVNWFCILDNCSVVIIVWCFIRIVFKNDIVFEKRSAPKTINRFQKRYIVFKTISETSVWNLPSSLFVRKHFLFFVQICLRNDRLGTWDKHGSSRFAPLASFTSPLPQGMAFVCFSRWFPS